TGVQACSLPIYDAAVDPLEDVVDLVVVEGLVVGEDILQEPPELGDVPLPVPEVVDEAADGLFGPGAERPVERLVGRLHAEVEVEDEETLADGVHDHFGEVAGGADVVGVVEDALGDAGVALLRGVVGGGARKAAGLGLRLLLGLRLACAVVGRVVRSHGSAVSRRGEAARSIRGRDAGGPGYGVSLVHEHVPSKRPPFESPATPPPGSRAGRGRKSVV